MSEPLEQDMHAFGEEERNNTVHVQWVPIKQYSHTANLYLCFTFFSLSLSLSHLPLSVSLSSYLSEEFSSLSSSSKLSLRHFFSTTVSSTLSCSSCLLPPSLLAELLLLYTVCALVVVNTGHMTPSSSCLYSELCSLLVGPRLSFLNCSLSFLNPASTDFMLATQAWPSIPEQQARSQWNNIAWCWWDLN